jgi:hypothetical protein
MAGRLSSRACGLGTRGRLGYRLERGVGTCARPSVGGERGEERRGTGRDVLAFIPIYTFLLGMVDVPCYRI